MKNLKLSILFYFISGSLAGGHFFANEMINPRFQSQKVISCAGVVMFNPIYWSYVLFNGDSND